MADPRRILFVEASVGGVLGGSLTGILHLLRGLDRERFAPSMVLYEHKPSVEADLARAGVPVHVLPDLPVPSADGRRGRLGRALLRASDLLGVVFPRAKALAAIIAAEKPAVVYLANGLTANLDGVVAAARCGVPVVCHEKGYRRVGPVERFLSRWVDVCIGMTEHVTEHYATRGVRPGRLVTVYDGIDRADFRPGGGAAVRAELGIPADAPVIGLVGHIQEWKGQRLVVEAFARVRARWPALRCLLVGGVHRQGEGYAQALQARIAELGLAQAVVLTGERADVAACLDAMDVAIHASVKPEPFGRVLIEAMALGRPLIAPREGGPLAIVDDGVTGLLVEPRDVDALAVAIETLIGDDERRRAMGVAALRRVDEVFDLRHHVRAIEALFAELLGDAPGGRAVA
jgi:glycosyltransferase involved in cell wall biosynthesis